ncbi:MAG TPA: hypothetical protein VMB79_12485 [Jatrophihabitans sp.]|nr:hypothetical protein [Jatrophihabitans sp.]
MSAASLHGSQVEGFEPDGIEHGLRLSSAASAASSRAAWSALAAAEVATPPIPAELDTFIDELAAIVHCPITVYQRELLQQALLGTIDARIAALLA